MEFHEQTLDNGLQVIAECNPNAHSTAMGFFVRTGARDETAEVSGVSHFLEHMTFKGTPNRSADDVNRELDEIGSHSNAYTSEEHTVYYAVVETETHWFLTYHFYHAADYTRCPVGLLPFGMEHENDGENLQVVVDRESGRVVLLSNSLHPAGRFAYTMRMTRKR